MSLIEIKNRYTNAVIYSGEGETIRQVVEAAVADRAYLAGANLAGAYLADANLADANLARAYLADANLAGVKWRDSLILTSPPVSIDGLPYRTWLINGTHLHIGCELHAISEWREFDDTRILQMDSRNALKFWRQYKQVLFDLSAAHFVTEDVPKKASAQ